MRAQNAFLIFLVFASFSFSAFGGSPKAQLAKVAAAAAADHSHEVDVLVIAGPGGHNLAADNVVKRLQEAGLTYARFDFSSLSPWTFAQTLELLERDPESSNKFYENYYRDAAKVESIADLPQAEWHSAEQFMSMLNLVRPKLILSTYAIAMELLEKLKKSGKIAKIPVGLIPTDYHPNRYWTYQLPQGADMVFPPSYEWAETSKKYGTSPSKLLVTGIPVNPNAERTLTAKEVAALWTGLDFDPKVTTVFVSGGSGGVGSFNLMLDSIRSEFLTRPKQKIQILVATGSNQKSFALVEAAREAMPKNVKLAALKFTPFAADYVNYVADIVAGKSGGLTTTEVARARGMKNGVLREGRPYLVTIPAYGIEGGNSEMLFREGMARPTRLETLGADIASLMDHPEVQVSMMANQSKIRRAVHTDEITKWSQSKISELSSKRVKPFVAAESTTWIADKLVDAQAKGTAPILMVSDVSPKDLISKVEKSAEVFKQATAETERKRLAKYRSRPMNSTAEPFDMAITVDDLPTGTGAFPGDSRRETNQKMIDVFKGHGIKDVYGFVNSANLDGWTDAQDILKDWRAAGFALGNHTDGHIGLTESSAKEYIADIERADRYLAGLGISESERRIFRYPMLQEGNTIEKRRDVLKYLQRNGYKVAPVTVDAMDYDVNHLYLHEKERRNSAGQNKAILNGIKNARANLNQTRDLSKRLFGREIRHILLLHLANVNAEMLDRLLGAYEAKGARFVSLNDALKDPVYKIDHGQAAPEMASFVQELAYATGYWDAEEGQQSQYSHPGKRLKLENACRNLINVKAPEIRHSISKAG
jgi:UDP-N-acetylglucosamine:LPS N-acetylglucosamine transferase/peptidoglycan/xylan/chitin deacetylase (PgdA/CDA1 family)